MVLKKDPVFYNLVRSIVFMKYSMTSFQRLYRSAIIFLQIVLSTCLYTIVHDHQLEAHRNYRRAEGADYRKAEIEMKLCCQFHLCSCLKCL